MLGIVVQLVRAPPCHGGSCEFESRQSRFESQLFFSRKTNNKHLIIKCLLLVITHLEILIEQSLIKDQIMSFQNMSMPHLQFQHLHMGKF